MKTASKIFIIIGIIANVILTVLSFTYWPYEYQSLIVSIRIIYIIISIISLIFGCIAFQTMEEENKSIAVGIFCIIFCSKLGGIFYLCWRPSPKASKENDLSTNSSIGVVENKSISDDIEQKLATLNKLRDENLISPEEYAEKRKELLDRI